MAKVSDNVFPRFLISEGGSTSTPAAAQVTVYAKANGLLYSKDDAGTETALGGGSGSVATDAIWDAAGDLAVGTGADTAAKLTKGADNTVLTISASTHVPVWAAPAAGLAALPIDAAAVAAVGSGDLFAGTSLDGGWSQLQTDVVVTDRTIDGYLIITHAGNTSGKDRGLKRTFSPAGDFTVVTKILTARLNENYQWSGIFAGETDPSDGAGCDRIGIHAVFNGGLKYKFVKMAAGSETVVFDSAVPGIAAFPIWLALRRVGSDLSAGISFDGVAWDWNATTTTIAFTVNTCGLHVAEASASTNLRTLFDYIATTG